MLCHLAVYASFVFYPKTVLCKIYVLLRHLTCQCRPALCKIKYYLNTLYVSRKIYMCCFDISHVIVAVLECIAGLHVSWTVQANVYCVHRQCFSIANFLLPRYKYGQWLARLTEAVAMTFGPVRFAEKAWLKVLFVDLLWEKNIISFMKQHDSREKGRCAALCGLLHVPVSWPPPLQFASAYE